MKIDFSQPLVNVKGERLKEEDGSEITLGSICANALMAPCTSPQTTETVSRMWLLAVRASGGGMVQMSSEEVTLIKECVVKAYQMPMISGQAVCLLEDYQPAAKAA